MNFIQTIKPGIPKRYLLFMAAIAWTFAGGMLLFKGILLLSNIKTFLGVKISISIVGGLLFYFLLFSKISLKHITRINKITIDKPCLFSFFNIKSYILMAIMITSGILLRKFGIIPSEYFVMVYITMGIPLFLSSFRFYFNGIYYDKFINSVRKKTT